jgi:hypothetical protein
LPDRAAGSVLKASTYKLPGGVIFQAETGERIYMNSHPFLARVFTRLIK